MEILPINGKSKMFFKMILMRRKVKCFRPKSDEVFLFEKKVIVYEDSLSVIYLQVGNMRIRMIT